MTPGGPSDLEVVFGVLQSLQALGIRAAVVGSVASTLHGEARFTRDVDVLACIEATDLWPIVRCFEREFYVSSEAVAEAIAAGSCFNLIHFDTALKVDVFVAAAAQQREEIARAVDKRLADGSGRALRVACAEDVVVAKLRWFDLGGRQTQQQWRDVIGVLRARRGRDLDIELMRRTAAASNVSELLESALVEAGVVPARLL